MSAEVFISYSRKDSAHADRLAQLFRAHGVDVWIDRHSIDGSTLWGGEIVDGIRACSTFIVLLSPSSTESENVLRELSLASEKGKRVLPVDIDLTTLPSAFEYPLAGLQHVSIGDFDAILHAHRHGVARRTVADTRKSLIVLPFEDLSPAGEDNAWFADGLTSELISALSHIKSLRIPDRKTSRDLKGFRGSTADIARELNVRYFVEGTVRKYGEQIKISCDLLDIETGHHLWQHSFRGEFKDIFDIQEQVGRDVVKGLELHLMKVEEERVIDRGTHNAEAYAFYIKAQEYFARQTREGYELAIKLSGEAIALDPTFAAAYSEKGNALASLYRTYDRDPKYLAEAADLVTEALRLRPDHLLAYHPLSVIYRLQGKLDLAEETAKRFVEKAPELAMAHFSLGFFYFNTGQAQKAIAPYEEVFRLSPTYLAGAWNLLTACSAAGDEEKVRQYAMLALPHFERHLKLRPDDEAMRVSYATLLNDAGRSEEARAAARGLSDIKDGTSLFNTACLLASLGDVEAAVQMTRRSIEAGYRNLNVINSLLEEKYMEVLKGSPDFESLRELIESVAAQGR